MAMARTASRAILFIGNSYTNRNDLPGLLTKLATTSRPPLEITTERVIANGMSLKTHWDRGIAAVAIKSKRWDFVVLQDQSTMGWKNPTRLKEYVTKFDAVCKANGAKTVLYSTWARKDAPERQAAITSAYRAAAGGINAIVVPVGEAWSTILRTHPEIILHDRDGSHPSKAGTYLAAYAFLLKLFDHRAVALPGEGITTLVSAALQNAAEVACKDD